MNVKKLLICAILLVVSQRIRAEYDVNAYCTLVANNIKLGSIDSCNTYYTCNNGIGTKNTCPASQSFDKNSQDCKPQSEVRCYIGNEQPCLLEAEGFVPLQGVCNGYIYCKNYTEIGRGYCPGNQIFYQGRCIFGECQNTGVNEEPVLTSVCQIMKDGLFFGSTKDCRTWQLCTNGVLSTGSCSPDYVFDVQIEKCNYLSGNMCSRVTGQEIQPDPSPTRPCTPTEKDTVDPDTATCSAYYSCDGTKWVAKSCGQGLYYSLVTKKCELRQLATPSADCNRCEFTRKQFVNKVDPDCRAYQICDSGKLKSSSECPDNTYFDEASQACLMDRNGKNTYALKNGACFNCDTTCAALSGAQCVPKDGCNCALDSTSNQCDVCHGLVVNGACDENPTCNTKCGTLTTNCVVDGNCNCGLDSTDKCVECSAAPVGGKCVDCDAECSKATVDTCANVGQCVCGVNDGKCEQCANAGDCNGCKCAGSTCPTGQTCECYVDTTNNDECMYCPNGVDTSGTNPTCK